MAFRLDRHEPVQRGVRRAGRKEVRAALGIARDRRLTASAVHALRKHVKRIRALLHIMEEHGDRSVRRSRRRLSRACRPLSQLRDVDVMRAALSDLVSSRPRAIPEDFQETLRSRVRRTRRRLVHTLRDDGVEKDVARALRNVRAEISAWRSRARGHEACVSGIVRSQTLCRQALRAVERRGSDAHYHEWRKQLARLRNQLMLFAKRAPRLRPDVQALDAAVHALGEDHNLVVLRSAFGSWCEEERSKGRPAPDTRRVLGLIAARQREYRRNALRLAAPICRHRPDVYRRTLEAAWSGESSPAAHGRAVR